MADQSAKCPTNIRNTGSVVCPSKGQMLHISPTALPLICTDFIRTYSVYTYTRTSELLTLNCWTVPTFSNSDRTL